MKVIVKYFAMVRERLGISEESLEFSEGTPVRAVYDHVATRVPELQPLLDRSMIMRNHEYVDLDDALAEGMRSPSYPPVSGGDHFRVHESELRSGSDSCNP